MALPRRRKKRKKRSAGRVNRAHQQWVRGHACSIPGCRQGPIVFAHVRAGIPAGGRRGGMAQKPGDELGIALCHGHHEESHQIGERTFARRHRIDPIALAVEFAARSPAMKESA